MGNTSSQDKRKQLDRATTGRGRRITLFLKRKSRRKKESRQESVKVLSLESFHEPSEGMGSQKHSDQQKSEEMAGGKSPLQSEGTKQAEKRDRRNKSKGKKKTSPKSSPKRKSSGVKGEHGRGKDLPDAQHSNNETPASTYGLNQHAEKKNVQYTVNETGESMQVSVDHDQCLVSPMTVSSSSFGPASSSSLSTTQQSLDSKDRQDATRMSTSNRDLFMETSLLTIGESGKKKVSAEDTGKSSDDDESDDSIAAEEHLYDDTNKDASKSPKKASGKGKVTRKERKKKDKQKKKTKKKVVEISGDRDDRKAQPQTTTVVPSAKIPSLEEISSTKLSTNNGKSGKKIKRNFEKVRSPYKSIGEIPDAPPPADRTPPPPALTLPTSASGKVHGRPRIQLKRSLSASAFASAKLTSPKAGKSDSTATTAVRRSSSARTHSHDSSRRMGLEELRERFGAQHESIPTLSPIAAAAVGHVEMPAELQAYGLPDVHRAKRPGLKKKEYRMSQRSLRNLEPELSGTDDDEDDNLVAYLKNSKYKLDL